MSRCIFYLMSKPLYLPQLVCSLASLRRHYSGDIYVYAWPESIDTVKVIAKDARLGIKALPRVPRYRGRNEQFIDKISLAMSLDANTALYLDADTTIHNNLDLLFTTAERTGFAATKFSDWRSNEGLQKKRIERVQGIPRLDAKAIATCLSSGVPALNGGVWATAPDSPVLPVWWSGTVAARRTFIADETILHTLYPLFYPRYFAVVGTSGQYNASPKYTPKEVADADVVIWHYHGRTRTEAVSEKGYALWNAAYTACLADNVGGINDWLQTVGNNEQ